MAERPFLRLKKKKKKKKWGRIRAREQKYTTRQSGSLPSLAIKKKKKIQSKGLFMNWHKYTGKG